MKIAPTEGAIRASPSPLGVTSARPPLQTLVTESRQFSCGGENTTQKALLLRKGWRRKHKLARFTTCPVNRWAVLLLYCLYCVFAGPAYINWTPLADILFRAGAFAWTCDENSSNRATPRRRVSATSSPVPPAAYARSAGVVTAPDKALPAATGTPTAAPAHAPGSSGPSVVADGTSSVHQVNSGTDSHSTRCAEGHHATAALGSRSSESMVRCADQEAEVNRLFTVTAASHFFFSFIGGFLLDTLGPKVTSMVGLSFGMIGWILLGAASKEVHSYLVGCLFLGAGIDTTYFPLLSGANLFPGHVSTVKALFGAAASFSFAVPLVLRGVYFTSNARIKHSTLFFGYAGVCLGAALLIAIFVVPWEPWKSPYRSLLSGGRQRPHPVAAACGLATQSSQLPAAASDRAFDIIAVHYSSSSLISPASISALSEEPPQSSSCYSRDGTPTSNPLATAARHLHPAGIHGDEQSASASSSQAARFGTETEYGLCDSASKSASDTRELNLSSSRASYANGATSGPSTKQRAIHPSLYGEYSNSSRRKSPADMRPHLRLDASRSKENESPPNVSDGSLCGQGSCSQLPHTINTDSHHDSLSFSLGSATLAPPWQYSRGRENTCFAAWPAGIRAKAGGALSTESASVPTLQPCDKPKTRETCTSAVDKAAKRSLCCSVEVPSAAARPSLLLGNTSAHAAALSNVLPSYEDTTREKWRLSVKGRQQPAPLDRLLSSTDTCLPAGPPRPSLPFDEHPSVARHMKVPCVYACSDTSRPTWTRRPWLPNAGGSNRFSSTLSFPASSTSSSPPVRRSPSLPIAASCRSYLPSQSFLLQASQPSFPLPPAHAAEASQVFTTSSAPASTAASLHIRKGEKAHTEDASSPQLLFSKSTPLERQKADPRTRHTPAVYREDNSCQSYDANRAVEEAASAYTVVTSAVHAAAAVVEGNFAEHSAAATADKTTKEPRSLRKMAQQQQPPFAGDNAKGGRALRTLHFQPSATCHRSASGIVPSADSLCDPYQEVVSGGALNVTAHVETRSAPAAVLEDSGIESDAHVGNIANSVSPSPPAVSMGSVGAARPLIKRTQASAIAGDAPPCQPARAGGLSATVARSLEPILFRTTPQQQAPACSASEPSRKCMSMHDTVLYRPLDAPSPDASIPAAAQASAPVVSASVACSREDLSKARFSFFKETWCKRSSRLQDSKQGTSQYHCLQQLLSAQREFLSALYLPIVPFFCIILTGMVFFIPSARHLLPSAYAANRIIQIFSFLPCPVFGHIADVCGIMPVMYICNFCGLLSFLFVMIPHIPAAVPLQYMASLLSASQLSFLVCQICCYVAETFDDENQGKLIGTLCCIAGLTSLSAHYIMDYAVRHGFLKPLIVFTAALAFNFPLLGFVHWRKQRTGRIHVAGRVFLSQNAPEDAAALGSRGRHNRHVPRFVEMSGAAEGPSPSASLPPQPAVHNSSRLGAAAVSTSGADAITNAAHAVSTSADAVATSAAGTTFTAVAATFAADGATPAVGAGTPAVASAVSACPDATQCYKTAANPPDAILTGSTAAGAACEGVGGAAAADVPAITPQRRD